jgi:HSP20 family molecular chaperone IbpA
MSNLLSYRNNINSDKTSYPISPRRVDLFGQLSREIDSAINDVFGVPFFVNGLKHKGYPLMDVVRNRDNLIIQYTVPGVKKEDLNVLITEENDEKFLEINGSLHNDYCHETSTYEIRELSAKEFRRIIRLPKDIKDLNPTVSLKDGILCLVFTLIKEETINNNKTKKLNIT